ncbi:hypothetical protein DLM45_02470 [Hyphomicrobium methylovorum]|uniref:hypothetical protein n=1 Tax=Hyphomicrobium methylovorum TaxID=84 RepID=UPI0015E7D1CD|nr:hypothetical protein [Hyphomicrobium methylovorum]MBA2125091.1 hypothetical protein [Hyphomicrobium methylovorum]
MTEAKAPAPAPDFALPLKVTRSITGAAVEDANEMIVAFGMKPHDAEAFVAAVNNTAAKDAEIARRREALKESKDRVIHYQKIAGEQGTMLFRKDVLLKTARQFGVLSRAYDGSVAVAIADAIDAGTPLAWPSSPFAQRWLNEHSYSDCRGLVGMRITMKLADGVEAGDDGTALSSIPTASDTAAHDAETGE